MRPRKLSDWTFKERTKNYGKEYLLRNNQHLVPLRNLSRRGKAGAWRKLESTIERRGLMLEKITICGSSMYVRKWRANQM
mmetsp:Transcript_59306/g.69353  ORF Transcript_59306/g.69353 Transcript_59306/m.69353 type:complete len:80 (+) Transcript_59306:107-346(+)